MRADEGAAAGGRASTAATGAGERAGERGADQVFDEMSGADKFGDASAALGAETSSRPKPDTERPFSCLGRPFEVVRLELPLLYSEYFVLAVLYRFIGSVSVEILSMSQ